MSVHIKTSGRAESSHTTQQEGRQQHARYYQTAHREHRIGHDVVGVAGVRVVTVNVVHISEYPLEVISSFRAVAVDLVIVEIAIMNVLRKVACESDIGHGSHC